MESRECALRSKQTGLLSQSLGSEGIMMEFVKREKRVHGVQEVKFQCLDMLQSAGVLYNIVVNKLILNSRLLTSKCLLSFTLL